MIVFTHMLTHERPEERILYFHSIFVQHCHPTTLLFFPDWTQINAAGYSHVSLIVAEQKQFFIILQIKF